MQAAPSAASAPGGPFSAPPTQLQAPTGSLVEAAAAGAELLGAAAHLEYYDHFKGIRESQAAQPAWKATAGRADGLHPT